MQNNGENTPIIIKKENKSSGHHGGAWKVAYADFVTAMMALFIVLWVLSQDEAMRESVAKYFKDPIGFSSQGKNVLKGDTKKLLNHSDAQSSNRETEMWELKKMGDKIITEISSDPEFSDLTGQITVEIVDEGLRIELNESSENIFFEIGTATLKDKAILLLNKIGNYLSKLPNKIIIEGHTDSRPYSGDGSGYTNFELSADRANSARRTLAVSNPLLLNQITEIRGYADKKLRDHADPFNVVNRRISIIVKFTEEERKGA
ncbi:MAG: flagellar motor protein MotB [Ignavibacteria bacterium]